MLRSSPIVGAGHHVRAKTNVPIIGILTQPIPSKENGDSDVWEKEFQRIKQKVIDSTDLKYESREKVEEKTFPKKQFIEATHVKFLQSSGARVIAIDYTKPIEKIRH